MFKTNT